MATIDTWSVRFSQTVAPDEVDLAPSITAAYLKGGKPRQQLFAVNNEVGGFGGDLITILPWVLNALVVISPLVTGLVASLPQMKDAVSVVNECLELYNASKKDKIKTLPDAHYAPLKRTVEALNRELSATPIPPEQRDLIIYRVLLGIINDPAGTVEFTTKAAEKK